MSIRTVLVRVTAASMATALTAACAIGGDDRPRHAPATAAPVASASSADDPVDYVVAISIDGLNPDAIRQLGPSGAPSFHRLMSEGASTLNARTEYERTNTLPNHTGMVTGRWITKTGGHRVTFNDDNGGTVHRTAGGYVASMFDVAHNRGRSTAFYSAKDKFNFLNRSWDGYHGARDRVGRNNGRDKIDRYYVATEPTNVSRLVNRLHNDPDELSFVHIAYPDRAGHANGFMSAAYVRAVQDADTQVGRILDAISSDPRLRAHADVVLTADHGGLGPTHTDVTAPANYTIPFMAWGVGVAKGADLYTLNADVRRDPGTSRPSYALRQPIRNGELANVVLDLLDLPPVVGSTFNTHQGLSVG
jgi:predicted AlkP superfamily pyrophosphatase or phosphodiesterase